MAGKIKVTETEYHGILFYLDTLFEGCDITQPLIEEICTNAYESLRPLLEKYKGRNVEDVRDEILGLLKII